ncbi:ABC transporter ATP-binding protein [Thermosediminibacter litoriperuensis]|uniref:ABC-2 type transport system ATP-binding protein n=1 Tax=Thermosediminibacter litoriperuensis TaxID=291989 RepID=A0A5S5AYX2_9FIRM|nr:ATP-binding cassette domain-containing protein [Thermosediminibacter litoriperuensis]TYP57677.1 ABC-2 type transport system ATP-binding protein [Thermosediminibacter litoriperuensis]
MCIEVNRVSKQYTLWKIKGWTRRERQVIEAVKDVSFRVEPGRALALIGPNGAGKSTMIKLLCGILSPTQGSIRVLEMDPFKDRSRLAYRISSVFGQRSQLWYHLPPIDTFQLLGRIYDIDRVELKKRMKELIELFDLSSFLYQPVRKLSLGQRMRCEIAAALIHKPKILFLDEPTIGLDVVARSTVIDILRDLNRHRNVTIILTSHDTGDIERICEDVIVLNEGKIVLESKIREMRKNFFHSKIIEIEFAEQPNDLNLLPGVRVFDQNGPVVKLEVDLKTCDVNEVVSRIVACNAVRDITIQDPPLESIIQHIYLSGYSAEREAGQNAQIDG